MTYVITPRCPAEGLGDLTIVPEPDERAEACLHNAGLNGVRGIKDGFDRDGQPVSHTYEYDAPGVTQVSMGTEAVKVVRALEAIGESAVVKTQNDERKLVEVEPSPSGLSRRRSLLDRIHLAHR
ncbi:MAG TPA: hypothetical protein VL989_03180 [Candidatus Sulfotelmatobacter sp.]|nr:hypothetical protein [Candidatus Sulfotelmatobacter sp.]